MTLPRPADHYWPRYCEENVWQLCGALETADLEHAMVIVISNRDRRVAVFGQRAAAEGEFVVWDYHVVLAVQQGSAFVILDADSVLHTPVPAEIYLTASFPPLPESLSAFRPRFRVVPAADYRATLASDRRHMREPGGGWLADPPPWPTIGRGHDLDRLIDLDDAFLGEVKSLDALHTMLAAATHPG